ncbi:MAG: acyltransferase [Lachnospiraceae bacterium]|jgi:peptidoglycan/LPS O-acetylase OafA/YrhL|nr:acyltransferase [Lachnospiraceae bacterium]
MDQKSKSLDILKGIGIIMIIAVHNRHFVMQDMSGLRQLINLGQMGCQLFFFASGFSLCHAWEHMDSSRSRIPRFLLRRYLRLAPGFLFFMIVNLMLNILLMDVLHLSPGFIMNREPRALLVNILFLHGLFPCAVNNVFPGGWYIGTAFLLYIAFPPLYTVFQKLRNVNLRPGCLSVCMAGVPALLLILNIPLLHLVSACAAKEELPLGNNTFLYYFFTNQLPCFSLGILLFFQHMHPNAPRRNPCPPAVYAALSAVSAVLCAALFLSPPMPLIYAVIPSLAGLAAYGIAAALIRIEKRGESARVHKRKRLTSPVSRFLASCGQHSYGMYLAHSLVSWYGMKALTALLTQNGRTYNDLLLYGLVFLPSVLIIYAMGVDVERALSRIDRRLRRS